MYQQKPSLLTNNVFKFIAIVLALFLIRYYFAVFVYYFFPHYAWDDTTQQFMVSAPKFYYGAGSAPETSPVYLWGKWDVTFYIDIATNGYSAPGIEANRFPNWGFFPLYPMLLKGIGEFFLFAGNFSAMVWLGAILSNIAFVAGLCALYLFLTRHVKLDSSGMKLVFLFLLLFPANYFFTLGYTEALFFLFSLLAVYFMAEKKLLFAGVFVGLSAVTRIQGLLLLLPLFYSYSYLLIEAKELTKRVLVSVGFALATAMSFLPVYLFFNYLKGLTGNFFAAYQAHDYLNNSSFFPFGFFIKFFQFFYKSPLIGYFINAQSIAVILLVFFWSVLGISLYSYYKGRVYNYVDTLLFVYGFVYLFFVSGLGIGVSIVRFLSVCFPLFILPVKYFKFYKMQKVVYAVLLIFALLQALFYIFFVSNIAAYGF